MLSSVVINPKGANRIRNGHPWVFRSDVVEASGAGGGDIVSVFTKNKLLGQAFFNPRSQITLRLLTRSREPINKDFLKKRIREAIDRRTPFFEGCEAFRLIFGESDFLPSLILDRYGEVLVFQTLSAGMERWKEDLIGIFQELLNPQAIIERNDPPVRDLEGLVRQKGVVRGGVPIPFEISVGAVRKPPLHILVDPLDGQKTGLFLDQAENHLAAVRYAKGRALDLFCYQGGFALHSAARSEEVLAVDSSSPALNLLRQNCEQNGIDNIKAIEANGFDFLRECQGKREFFDTIILDPPPFVRDRKNLVGGVRGYKEINLRAMKILRSGGILITCSCSQNFSNTMFV
jgi:23S rRNA (cytosine1962-C5)-methyltransferase